MPDDPRNQILDHTDDVGPDDPKLETVEGWRDACVVGSAGSSRHDKAELFSAARGRRHVSVAALTHERPPSSSSGSGGGNCFSSSFAGM